MALAVGILVIAGALLLTGLVREPLAFLIVPVALVVGLLTLVMLWGMTVVTIDFVRGAASVWHETRSPRKTIFIMTEALGPAIKGAALAGWRAWHGVYVLPDAVPGAAVNPDAPGALEPNFPAPPYDRTFTSSTVEFRVGFFWKRWTVGQLQQFASAYGVDVLIEQMGWGPMSSTMRVTVSGGRTATEQFLNDMQIAFRRLRDD